MKPKLIVTKSLLSGSYREKFHNQFLNKVFNNSDVYGYLSKIRNYLVHPLIDKGVPASYLHLDTIESMETLEAYSNLVERIVTKILETQLKILAENDGEIKKMIDYFGQLKS